MEEGKETVSSGVREGFGIVEAEGLECREEGERSEGTGVDHGTWKSAEQEHNQGQSDRRRVRMGNAEPVENR